MNLKSYLLGLFRGFSANGELDSVREAAQQDAKLIVGTYLQSFEAEAARLFTERQQRFIGWDDPGDTIDVDVVDTRDNQPDYSEWSRPELMREAKRQGIEYGRDVTKGQLLTALERIG